MSDLPTSSRDREQPSDDAVLPMALSGRVDRKYVRFVLAALGSIPWVGGLIAASSALSAENEQAEANAFMVRWMDEHRHKAEALQAALGAILTRLDELGDEIDERITSEEYLALVRRSFQVWDAAEKGMRRDLVRKLLTNSAATRLCSDDVVRLFLDWIEAYHEIHFRVIAIVYQQPGATRLDIGRSLYGDLPREDSAEADLFRLLIRDLSTGGVIRQRRETTYSGEFVKRQPKRRKSASRTMKSAFSADEPYVLTALGEQFVHYAMDELIPRLGSSS